MNRRSAPWLGGAVALLSMGLLFVPAASADAPMIQVGQTAKLGPVLVNAQGMTFYWLEGEVGGKIYCSDKCLSFWPPLLLPAGASAPTVGAGVTGTFGYVTRPDGSRQVTWNSYPLYNFVADKAPGDTNGEGVKGPEGLWHAARVTAAPLALLNLISQSPVGVSASFSVSFSSSSPGQGMVYFGPACNALVEVGTHDLTPGSTTHTVTVTGNDLPGTVGDIGLTPGTTYYYETVTATSSGQQIDSNGGACYSVTIPSS